MNGIFIYKIQDFIDENHKNAKKHIAYVYMLFYFWFPLQVISVCVEFDVGLFSDVSDR